MYGAHVIEYLTSLTIMYNSLKKHTKMFKKFPQNMSIETFNISFMDSTR